MPDLKARVKECALDLGFDLVRVTTAEPFLRDERAAVERVRQGLMDGLPWYTEDRVRKANRPESLLEGAKSVVSLAVSYNTGEPEEDSPLRGKVARYAWGDDYHELLKPRLRRFADALTPLAGREVRTRVFVDDGPMNDRAAAARSGLGWFGKNTNILTPTHGSWVFLGQVVTDLELAPDAPLAKTCGNCVRCIDDCPTGAIVAPYVIDNRQVHLVSHHRAARPNPPRAAAPGGRLGVRLRHLPGRLPRQPQGAARRRARFPPAR